MDDEAFNVTVLSIKFEGFPHLSLHLIDKRNGSSGCRKVGSTTTQQSGLVGTTLIVGWPPND